MMSIKKILFLSIMLSGELIGGPQEDAERLKKEIKADSDIVAQRQKEIATQQAATLQKIALSQADEARLTKIPDAAALSPVGALNVAAIDAAAELKAQINSSTKEKEMVGLMRREDMTYTTKDLAEKYRDWKSTWQFPTLSGGAFCFTVAQLDAPSLSICLDTADHLENIGVYSVTLMKAGEAPLAAVHTNPTRTPLAVTITTPHYQGLNGTVEQVYWIAYTPSKITGGWGSIPGEKVGYSIMLTQPRFDIRSFSFTSAQGKLTLNNIAVLGKTNNQPTPAPFFASVSSGEQISNRGKKSEPATESLPIAAPSTPRIAKKGTVSVDPSNTKRITGQLPQANTGTFIFTPQAGTQLSITDKTGSPAGHILFDPAQGIIALTPVIDDISSGKASPLTALTPETAPQYTDAEQR